MVERADKKQNAGQSSSSYDEGKDAGDVTSQAKSAMNSARSKKSKTAFRTISEVADELDVQQHVLRFWETKFTHIKPLKRGGGRRYYRPEDVQLIKAVHHLLYVEGYTIKGVQKLFREVGKKQIVISFGGDNPTHAGQTGTIDRTKGTSSNKQSLTPEQKETLQNVLSELKELRGMVRKRN